MRCRRNYRDLTPAERSRFVAALSYLKGTGVIDQFASDHANFFSNAHGGSSFLPWHREFFRRFEDELRTFDSRITIPYWDWTVDNSTAADLWAADFLGGFDGAWTLNRNLGGGGSLPAIGQVQATLAITPYSAFWSSLESNIHNPPHNWVGGVMASAASPGDPVFYLHHCFIDLLWAQWQVLHPGEAFMASGGSAGQGLNDAMPPWSTTPADVLDHRAINAYAYPAGFTADPLIVGLDTPTITFNDVPEGETAMRAAVFGLDFCGLVTLQVVSGPTVLSGPAGTTFGTLAPGVTANPRADPKGRLWFTYTGTNDGDSATGTVAIRCVETGEQWDIPITANTINRPTAAVALALDQSNSMTFDSGIGAGITRGDVLKFSAPPFVDVLQDENAVAIFSFDHDPHPGIGITPVSGGGRVLANGTIAGYAPNPNGWTSIGEAVAFAHDLLEPVTGYDIKAMVVLTDGQENHGDYQRRYIADIADLINERVYAIGLGSAENINPAALQALCDGNEGYLLLTGDLNADAYFRLAKYYQQILAGVTNQEIVRDPEGWIRPGQKHRIPFSLNEADITATAVLLTPAPFGIRFVLETPAGDVIDPGVAGAHPMITFQLGSNVEYYRTGLPLPIGAGDAHAGTWYAVLVVDDRYYKRYLAALDNHPELYAQAQAHGIRYSFNVQAYSNLRMRARLSQNSFEPGATLTVRTLLTEYGLPVAGRAAVRAELARPDGSGATLALAEVEPGVFEVSTPAATNGIYQLRVLAEGHTMRGRRFTREQTLTGAVWAGGDRPFPTSQADPRGRDERLCRLLECLLKQEKLQRSLAKAGVDVEDLRRCLREFCARRPPSRGRMRGTLESRLAEVLRDEGTVQAVLGEARKMEEDDS